MRNFKTTTALVSAGILFLGCNAYAKEPDQNDLLDLSLEQLSNISVTSVSKRSEKASEAAAAIFVITQDDIRRSGLTSIPELLRMVPGISVAQASAHQWTITSRGFGGQYSNKLLVLMDGRSVYTPLFSGVFWDAQDTLLEDIERIEVIRGPGATLWGANAVNGVINIITKKAQDTQGNLMALTVGDQEKGLARGRTGMKIGDNAYFRSYVKYDDRDETRTTSDTRGYDAWNKAQGGFRTDIESSDKHSFTLQGDLYTIADSGMLSVPDLGSGTRSILDREHAKGGNILGRWNMKMAKDEDATLQMYFDNVQRENFVYDDSRNTFDIDFQHSLVPDKRHEVVWGAGYRLVWDDVRGSSVFVLTPQKRSDNLFSAFVQDKIALIENEFFITLGSKFEHNDYTGFEYQPSARLSWIINDKQTVWSSVSRAVRTPNRFSDDGSLATLVAAGPSYVGTIGNENLKSEELIAYEAGYRIQATDKLSFDVATFYNDYNHLVLGQLGSLTQVSFPGLGNVFYTPVIPVNLNKAKSYGFELSSKWNVTNNFDLTAGYTFFDLKLDQGDPLGFEYAGKTPKHQFNLRSNWRMMDNIEWNNSAYFVDSLNRPTIDQYLRFDTRLAWKPIESLELSIVGQNLFDPHHQEFSAYTFQGNAEIPRSVYGNITWKF